MNRQGKFGVGALLLVGAIGYLVYAGVQQGSVYYFTIEEFAARRQTLEGEGVRVAGRVAAGSVRKQTTAAGTQLDFVLGEFVTGGGSAPGVPVHFTGVLPDMFAEGRDVIVEGAYHDGVLHAQTVMTSCPSKYEAAPGQAGAVAARDP
jgi:cytochrome c-type biogenesis protein CcmE